MMKKSVQSWSHDRYLKALYTLGSGVIPLEPYINMHTKILHECPCGTQWVVSPMAIRNGSKCKDCGDKQRIMARCMSINSFEQKARIRNPGIILDHIPEGNQETKVLFKCIDCGAGQCKSKKNILRGLTRCPKCHIHNGFTGEYYRGKPSWLYYIKIDDMFKIGITLDKGDLEKSLNYRYSNFNEFKLRKQEVQILNGFKFKNGLDAFEIEAYIKKYNIEFKYKGDKIMKSGNSELFSIDIMGNI